MSSPARICSEPWCSQVAPKGGRCPRCRRTADRKRPSAAARGYGARWTKEIRPAFLQAHPYCIDCGRTATVPDHDPVPRIELVRRRDPNPDAWHHLKPRCTRCHNRKTATLERTLTHDL